MVAALMEFQHHDIETEAADARASVQGFVEAVETTNVIDECVKGTLIGKPLGVSMVLE